MTLYYAILGVLTIIVIALSVKTNMLRNVVFNCDNYNANAAKKNIAAPKLAFSLGRTQLAFWSVIVIGSYIYLLLTRCDSPQIKIPDVNLILLGIAAGTTAVAKVIDNSQKDSASQNPDTVAQQDIPSKGFLTDIISDETGVSIHRLQNVIWTIVVGAVYISWVSSKTLMPDNLVITNTLLGLMGISSAAYLGVKTTENSTPVNQPGNAGGGGGNGGAGNGGGGNAGGGNNGANAGGANNAGNAAGNAGVGNNAADGVGNGIAGNAAANAGGNADANADPGPPAGEI